MTQNVPTEIEQVAKAWRANAKEAGMPEDACYVYDEPQSRAHYGPYYQDPWGDWDRNIIDSGEEEPAWTVCCNYSRAGMSLTYFPSDGRWLYYARGRESSSLIKGGLSEAIANAEIVYTG